MSQLLEELEWLGNHLDPLEQTIVLNNLDKLINDQGANLMERIKRGERPADVFSSPPPLDGPENPDAMTESAPRRRRRVSAGPAGGPPKKAVALSTSDSVPESDSPGNGVVPGNPRKRCRDAECKELV